MAADTNITSIINDIITDNSCVTVVLSSNLKTVPRNNENLFLEINTQSDGYITNKLLSCLSFAVFLTSITNFTQIGVCTPTSYVIILTKTNDTLPDWYKFKPHLLILVVFINVDITYNPEWELHLSNSRLHGLTIYRLNVTKWPPLDVPNDFKQTNETKETKQTVFMPGKPIKALGFELLPYFKVGSEETNEETQYQHVTGLEVEILQMITSDWPVEIEARPMFSWDTILGDLEQHKADLGLSAVWLSRILKHDLDFLSAYMPVTSTFLVPDATLLPPETYVFQSLSTGVWLLIVLAIISVGQLLRVISKYHSRKKIDNSMMLALALFAINSTRYTSNSSLMKGVLLMWSFLCLLLSTSYSAGFTSIANVPRTTKPINTFQDAVDRALSCYSLGDFSQGLLKASGETSKIEFAHNMAIVFKNPPVGVCTGVDILLNNYLFAGYSLEIIDLITLKLLKENIQSTFNVFAISRNSPYFRELDHRMIQLKEHGFITFLIQKYTNTQWSLYAIKDFDRNLLNNAGYKPTAFEKVQGVFYMLIVGYILGLCGFCAEWIKHQRTNARKTKQVKQMNRTPQTSFKTTKVPVIRNV